MKKVYLNRVATYLKKEMPKPYQDGSINADKIIIVIADDKPFATTYNLLHRAITDCISRGRKLEFDLDFTIRATQQERDFRLYK